MAVATPATSSPTAITPAAQSDPNLRQKQLVLAGILRSTGFTPGSQAASTAKTAIPAAKATTNSNIVSTNNPWQVSTYYAPETDGGAGGSGRSPWDATKNLAGAANVDWAKLGYSGDTIKQGTTGAQDDSGSNGSSSVNADFANWLDTNGYTPGEAGGTAADKNSYQGVLDKNGKPVEGTVFRNVDDNQFWAAAQLAAAVVGGAVGSAGTAGTTAAGNAATTGAATAATEAGTSSALQTAITTALKQGGINAAMSAANGAGGSDVLKSFGIGALSSGAGSLASGLGASSAVASGIGSATGAAASGAKGADILKAGLTSGVGSAVGSAVGNSDALKGLDPTIQKALTGAATGATTGLLGGGTAKSALLGGITGAAKINPATSLVVKAILQQILAGQTTSAPKPVAKKG